MKRLNMFFLLACLLMFTVGAFGQRLHYRDCKKDITLNNYREIIVHERYSPLAAGLANYIFPSAGYFYVGEPLRGALVFGSEMLCTGVVLTGFVMSMSVHYETGDVPRGSRALILSGLLGTTFIHLWSIYDVAKVARVKNLAYQDLRLSMHLKPDFSLQNVNDCKVQTYGVRLAINF
ncbi:hypothetical protein [Roseimarinus sediminis]|uniref:hypothetical protein n=1 Tax=Roseimarinus sediminis TaxID=1610899 RepID=UPI003D2282F1